MQPQAEGQESTFIKKLKESLMPVTKLKSFQLRIGLVVILVVIMLGFVYKSNLHNAYALTIDGKQVAVVSSQKDAENIINQLIKKQENNFNQQISVGPEIEYEKLKANSADFTPSGKLEKLLAGTLFFQTDGFVIKINGEDKVILKNKDKAKQVLEKVKESYLEDENEVKKVFFEEKVVLEERKVRTEKILEVSQAVKLITQGVEEINQYTVQEGDTVWDIAQAGETSIEQLEEANPELNPDKLNIGQKINLTKTVPLLNVVAVINDTVKEKIDFPIEVKQDNNLYIGQRKVLQQGVPGEKQATYEITERNGQEYQRDLIEEEIIKEAVPQVIARGSRVLVASRGSGRAGSLAWPTGGSTTSAFGSRWGRSHTGIDISGSVGNPVVAAESGKVIRAGSYGGYGNCIDISHGNGVVTRYAHLSSFAVSVGSKVSRGQLVGKVGATGNVTGPHLHFEVIINGKQQNPSSFL